MTRPLILAIDDDPGRLSDVERELRARYLTHYDVLIRSDAGEALDLLRGDCCWPTARRGAIARCGTSCSTDFMLGWHEDRSAAPHTIQVIGETWAGRAYELRPVLGRCALPHVFRLADSPEGRAVLAQAGEPPRLPLPVYPDGQVASDPSEAEIAPGAGTPVGPDDGEYDMVVVGSGPAGLSAAVYAASEGLRTLVVDQVALGGQATALEALAGAGVVYGAAASEAPTTVGEEIVVVGGANSAGQAGLHLSRYARQVTLVVRADSLDVGRSAYLVRQVRATANVAVRLQT